MHLVLIKNPDETKSDIYKIARVIYAQTGAVSLRAVEALASMIANNARANHCACIDVVSDANLFSVVNPASSNHERMYVDASDSRLQMCVRTVTRMMHGLLPDACYGATLFHMADDLPDWAMARGYIADIDGMLFYL